MEHLLAEPYDAQLSNQVPPLISFCPKDSWWDTNNCNLGDVTDPLQPFIYDYGFYHTGNANQCTNGSVHDGVNCIKRPTLAYHDSFIWNNDSWYTSKHSNLLWMPTECPANATLVPLGLYGNLYKCLIGSPPTGYSAIVHNNYFGFQIYANQNLTCQSVQPDLKCFQ